MSLQSQLAERAKRALADGDQALATLLDAARDQLRARERRVLAMPGGVSMTPPMLRRALEIVAPEGTVEEEDAVVVVHQRQVGDAIGTFAHAASLGPETAQRLDAPSIEDRLAAEGPSFDPPARRVARISEVTDLRPRREPPPLEDTNSLALAIVDALALAFQRGQAAPRAGEETALAVAEDILMGECVPGDYVPVRS